MEVSLLVNGKYVGANGSLPERFPLRDLPYRTIPGPELLIERMGRTFNHPKLDRWSPDADWYYSPMEGRLPVRNGRNATTIHDVQALETDLPWSDTREHRRFRRKWEYWLPKAFQSVDQILTVSEFSKNRMVELLGAKAEKIAVIGNGVDEAFYQAGDRIAGRIEKVPEVVVVGGLRYKKGADWVFEVADYLEHMMSRLSIVVMGQHDPEYVARAHAHPRIEVLGMVEDGALIDRLASASAQLLLSHYEGFGIPALEAMAVGTPAVVSDRGSLPEIVGNAGLVVEPERTSDIAELLDSLDPSSRAYMHRVQQGRDHARTYTWDRCVDRLVEVFGR